MLLHFPKANADIILTLGEKQKGGKRIGAEILVIRLKNLLPNTFLNEQDNTIYHNYTGKSIYRNTLEQKYYSLYGKLQNKWHLPRFYPGRLRVWSNNCQGTIPPLKGTAPSFPSRAGLVGATQTVLTKGLAGHSQIGQAFITFHTLKGPDFSVIQYFWFAFQSTFLSRVVSGMSCHRERP